jgi:hypothetical protein
MKPNVISVTTPTNSSLTVIPTAKIVRHPRSKKLKEDDRPLDPPDEETLKRLNAMAKQFPFCILHRGNNHSWLL